jgi:hypothetical protein
LEAIAPFHCFRARQAFMSAKDQSGEHDFGRLSVPITGIQCPTRRRPIAYPMDAGWNWWTPLNFDMPQVTMRSDYAGNGGDCYTSVYYYGIFPTGPAWQGGGPNSEAGPASIAEVESPVGQQTAKARTTFGHVAAAATGILCAGSLIQMSDITDGTAIRVRRTTWTRTGSRSG